MDIQFENWKSTAADGGLTVTELIIATNQLWGAGKTDWAIELYQTWIASHGNDPMLSFMYFNFGVYLSNAGKLVEACEAYNNALLRNGALLSAHVNLGNVLDRLKQTELALGQYRAAAAALALVTPENIQLKAIALKQIGRTLTQSEKYGLAEAALVESLSIGKDQVDVAGSLINLRMRQCAWPILRAADGITADQLINWMAPLSVAQHCDDPLFQLAAGGRAVQAELNAASEPRVAGGWPVEPVAGRKKLRIGYLSSDLRNHAIGSLMAEVFGLHDREKVEVYAYFCGVEGEDYHQKIIKDSVDVWVNVTPLDDKACATRILDDGIDILIDVNGHTAGSRISMLAMRPAPIIVNWLGYPGSMGGGFHQYILADGYIIPKEHEAFYSEKVMRLPCYQPNDRKRRVREGQERREAHTLPDDAVVFGCLNGNTKITEFIFRLWMRILSQVPKGVLWLLEDSDEASNNLRRVAESCGVAGDRLIFAKRVDSASHLSRLRLVDLFLDTYPYGAHTTASDALWMGVPILTLSGLSFASRVCGSLISSAGAAELITRSPEEYVARGIALGHDPDALLALRRKIESNKGGCVLFNMELLVHSLEALYAEMWDEYAGGRMVEPNTRHLATYAETAVFVHRQEQRHRTLQQYLDLYRRHLAHNEAYRLRDQRPPWVL